MSYNIRNDARREHYRFPCEQIEYIKTVGELLLTILGEILTELGFNVRINNQQANGVDFEVSLGQNLILVAEVLNWSIGSRLTYRRKGNIIRNLNQFNCNKMLIYTVPLSNLYGLRANGIHLLEIGYQILPETYYNFFQAKEQLVRRNVDCDLTRREIRAKILDYLNNHLFAHKYFKSIIK